MTDNGKRPFAHFRMISAWSKNSSAATEYRLVILQHKELPKRLTHHIGCEDTQYDYDTHTTIQAEHLFSFTSLLKRRNHVISEISVLLEQHTFYASRGG